MKTTIFRSARMCFMQLCAAVSVAMIFAACSKNDDGPAPDAIDRSSQGLSAETIAELRMAKNATAKYRSIDSAIADGYADIGVIQQNMGFHLMRSALLDTLFNPALPEILVYNKQHDGSTQLVAVEYAVPIPLMPNSAPQGFTGSSDNWTYSTTFNLWLLHSWVWEYNPQGIFNPTNPLVHLH